MLNFRSMEPSIFRYGLVFLRKPLIKHTFGKVPVTSSRKTTFIVQHGKNTNLLHLNCVKTVLVIRERDERPFNVLRLVLSLLQLENEFIELLLKSFVREVNTELFERVDIKALKTENIQDTDGGSHISVIFQGSEDWR